MKIWFTAQELKLIEGLPGTIQGVLNKAKRDEWQARPRSGRGGGNEYHIDSLPAKAQTAIRISQAKKAAKNAAAAPRLNSNELWTRYEAATTTAKEKAEQKLKAVLVVKQLQQHGTQKSAIAAAVEQFSIGASSIKRYLSQVDGHDQSDWLAALTDAPKGHRPKDEFSPEAWEFFKADYLRLEKPTIASCFHRLERSGKEHGWSFPSYRTLQRHIKEIPLTQRVLMREGEHALMRLYPPQQRTVSSLHALAWINGDGYQHNVFVRWPDGEIARPKTWFWQDIYSRKILAYRVDVTENTDMLRLSFGDVVENYGIPADVTIDNTRAAANKWMSGGTKTRYRFKVKEDDPMGIFPLLGCQVHWTSVHNGKGHGQSKPVERAFGVGGLGDAVDKHPAFSGAFTGENPTAKPENYGSKAVDLETFLKTLNAEIIAWNARGKRRTETGAGIHSFDEVFESSYSNAVIRKATAEQRRLWLLAAESVTVQREAFISLNAGAKVGQGREGRNRYYANALHDYIGEKVTVRFDPQDLHGDVHIYLQNGQYLTTANCLEAVGFGDTEAGRSYSKTRKQFMKATKQAAKAQVKLNAMDIASQLPAPEDAPALEASVVRPFKDPMARPEQTPTTPEWFDKEAAIESLKDELTAHPSKPSAPKLAPVVKPDFNKGLTVPEDLAERYQFWEKIIGKIQEGSANEEETKWAKTFKGSLKWSTGKMLQEMRQEASGQ